MEDTRYELAKERHRNLAIWKTAFDLSNDIYTLTRQFPTEEQFGLTSQLRRAGVSVPSNIAEGSKRPDADFVRFLDYALGSLAEIDTQLLIAETQGYMVYSDELQRKIVGLSAGIRAFRAKLVSR